MTFADRLAQNSFDNTLKSLTFSPAAKLAKPPFPPEAHQILFLNGAWIPTAPQDVLTGDAVNGYTLSASLPLVELLFINTPETKPVEATTKLRIDLDAGQRLTLIERHIAPEAKGDVFAHALETEIELGERADFLHGKIAQGVSVHLAQVNVKIGTDACYDNFALLGNARIIQNRIDATLLGENAQCRLQGLMLLNGQTRAETITRVTHKAPHGTSRQFYKSVIDDQAHGVFQGKIAVDPKALKTDGYQLSRALLLTPQAKIDVKPELEIYADDVKCSHGSTIGDLDEQALFYLRSRGIDEKAARKLLIDAFVDEIVDTILDSHVREAIQTARGLI